MMTLSSRSWCMLLLLPKFVSSHGQQCVSRHLLVEDLSMVALIQDATTTEGPYDEEESDYITDPDMTLAARAGADGVMVDRLSVLDGIPLEITVNVYGIGDRSATVATELEGVEVNLWHCDAAGVYSAADQEGTEGEKWLRGRQFTDADGSATFNTIVPGLYRGRMSHIHIRLRLPGDTGFAAISQLYFSDDDVDQYRQVGIYADSTVPTTYSTSDNIYRGVDTPIRELLTLPIQGDFETSVSTQVSLALVTDVPAVTNTNAPVEVPTMTDSPVTPVPVTPAPVTPAPVTAAPVTPAPVTAAPVTPAPVTPAPALPADTESPVASPAATESPVASPADTESPVASPAATESPVASPAATESPVALPAATESPVASSPALTESPVALPTINESPTSNMMPILSWLSLSVALVPCIAVFLSN